MSLIVIYDLSHRTETLQVTYTISLINTGYEKDAWCYETGPVQRNKQH